MNDIVTRTIAGIVVPDTPVIDKAIEHARTHCEPYLFNHVMRSWLFAARLGQLRGEPHDGEIVAIGTVLHDVTLNEQFAGPRRFEVEGADLARDFAREAGFSDGRVQLLWDSVALNSTPSIGLYKEPEVALCTAGICLDVVGLQYDLLTQSEIGRIVDAFPRLDMKRRMTRCFCHIAKTQPETTYDNFARDFGERFGRRLPGAVIGGFRHERAIRRMSAPIPNSSRSSTMCKCATLFALALALSHSVGAAAETPKQQPKPTIVLVHGAFAESSSWSAVINHLERDGYHVIAAANPLRGVKSDAASVSATVRSIAGPVILVGHSYGGPVITEAANNLGNVRALVYVAGFAPDTGETSLTLSAKFPGSTLGTSLSTVALPDGDEELYILPEKFRAQFAADVPAGSAAVMAATQRPVTLSALGEPSGSPSWRKLPSYMIYGSADRNIPAAVMKFMAERAKSRKIVVVEGASHAVMVSHPGEVTSLIEQAAATQ